MPRAESASLTSPVSLAKAAISKSSSRTMDITLAMSSAISTFVSRAQLVQLMGTCFLKATKFQVRIRSSGSNSAIRQRARIIVHLSRTITIQAQPCQSSSNKRRQIWLKIRFFKLSVLVVTALSKIKKYRLLGTYPACSARTSHAANVLPNHSENIYFFDCKVTE